MWRWRAFGSRFGVSALLGSSRPAGEERRADTYLVAPGLGAGRGLALRRGVTLELEVHRESRGAVERWEEPFAHDLEVPPWRTRELARLLAPDAPVPVRPLRSLDDVARLVRDLRLGDPRTVPVTKATTSLVLDEGVRLERTALRVDGRDLETIVLEGADPDAVLALTTRLVLPGDARVASYPRWLSAP